MWPTLVPIRRRPVEQKNAKLIKETKGEGEIRFTERGSLLPPTFWRTLILHELSISLWGIFTQDQRQNYGWEGRGWRWCILTDTLPSKRSVVPAIPVPTLQCFAGASHRVRFVKSESWNWKPAKRLRNRPTLFNLWPIARRVVGPCVPVTVSHPLLFLVSPLHPPLFSSPIFLSVF